MQMTTKIPAGQNKTGFNLNKFHAIACMAASAVVSICLIALVVKTIS